MCRGEESRRLTTYSERVKQKEEKEEKKEGKKKKQREREIKECESSIYHWLFRAGFLNLVITDILDHRILSSFLFF